MGCWWLLSLFECVLSACLSDSLWILYVLCHITLLYTFRSTSKMSGVHPAPSAPPVDTGKEQPPSYSELYPEPPPPQPYQGGYIGPQPASNPDATPGYVTVPIPAATVYSPVISQSGVQLVDCRSIPDFLIPEHNRQYIDQMHVSIAIFLPCLSLLQVVNNCHKLGQL